MFRPFSASFAALGLAFALPACAQPAATKDADPALWVVKDKDTTIYLFGTIHVLKPGLSWFDEAVKKAFDNSGTLVLEMVEPDQATQQKVVLSKAFAPDGPTLSEQLPAEKRAVMAKALTDNGLSLSQYDRMRPWFAAITLSILPLEKIGYDPANGPEGILTRAAQAQKKQVIGLETFEGQMSIFDKLSQKGQIELLTSTIDELPKARENMDKMVDEWARGRPEELAKDMNASLKDTPEVAETLLLNRNRQWAGWIAERMKTPGTVFIAVGAGHLAGQGSVQDQLLRYKLKAVRIKY
ncbi:MULTISPECIES: TraB/GumN family protein [unclassified Sphingomonas]|uniref:TraB/GumN family protein n=1 Tax=unclassified Sphingomonas TaxID=196159 RepID=UPI000928E5C2|nr:MULTISPECIES: TraB/GumN family protein [unclassified Sphingomonas]MBN8849133.1 TraB/GumN family protein [Sphingomonas sp.]OJV32791.1 MAG: TraB/GumN family protein [Sphingomonas sp. 67-36]